MATAAPKKKIERAYTIKDIESDDIECVMINRLNSKKLALRNVPETVSFEIRSILLYMINELNGTVSRFLTSCEQKERDKASLLILQTLDTIATKTSAKTFGHGTIH